MLILILSLSRLAVYFDGFLPSSKRAERVKRLLKSTRELQNFYHAFSNGVQKDREQFVANPKAVDLFPKSWGGEARTKAPAPAFLVPAIIEALKASTKYASLTEVMPGEADLFCARRIRQSGGIVLTHDSDLLIHDLGPEGSVLFFSDIDLGSPDSGSRSRPIVGLHFKISEICERLSIKPDHGLAHLAFELVMDPHISLEQAASRSRREAAVSCYPKFYTEFIEQYLTPETAVMADVSGLDIDPRVAEIALKSAQSGTTHEGEIAMFLPLLLDSPSRTSAWEASKPTRELAYALLQHAVDSNIVAVSEFRRLQSPSAGVRIDVAKVSTLDRECDKLLSALSTIRADVISSEATWLTYALYQDIILTNSQGKTRSLSFELLQKDAAGKLNPYSWDSVHLVAQIQASYYSMRMLQQILAFAKQERKELPESMGQLLDRLESLPRLASFPSLNNCAEVLKTARSNPVLSCLASLGRDIEDIKAQIDAIERPREAAKETKKRKRQQKGQEVSQKRVVASNNPFDLLGTD